MTVRQLLRFFLPQRLECAIRYLLYGTLSWDERKLPEIVIGMTTADEQRYYADCAARMVNTEGAIVDLGSWFCSTAISLAKGLLENALDSRAKVYAIDRFVWEGWMNAHAASLACKYEPGESFLPEVRSTIRNYSSIISLVKADLTNYQWKRGSIKILLIDAMKNMSLAQSITQTFYPHLKCGSIVIHQDFKHYYTPWIHILQYRLRDYCRFCHEVQNGATVAFEVIHDIPEDALNCASNFQNVSRTEMSDIMGYSRSLCKNDVGKAKVSAAHVMYYVHTNQVEDALATLAKYTDGDIAAGSELAKVKELVDRMSVLSVAAV